MQEEQLKKLIITRLTEISLLKGIELKEEHYIVWCNKIYTDYLSGLVVDIKSGFKKLESEKHYSGLDYSIFLDGAKSNEDQRIEKEWAEVVNFKQLGDSKMSLKTKMVIKNLGGMGWFWDSMKSDVDHKKRNFINAWKSTPDPKDNDFHCPGVEDNRVYLPISNIRRIECV